MTKLSTTRRSLRRTSVLVAAGLIVSILAVRADADPLDPYLGNPGRSLPNLVPTVADIHVDDYRFTDTAFEQGQFLLFDTRAQNLGTVPLQLTVDEVDTPETSTVSQCVSWRSVEAHLCRATEPAGGFTWHDDHNHFHYTDFATYQLRKVVGNRPDYSDAGLVRRADKVSFCLVDSDTARPDARPVPLYKSCLPAVQGITPGWTDIYDYDTVGQNFPLAGMTDGTYALVIDMDYANTILETDDTDNYVEVIFEISGGLKDVQIVSHHWPPPDDRGTPTTTTTTTKKKPKKPKVPHTNNGNGN
ncbi:MAG TPA: lysyl oxidase family protein [Acidimicrobiales bacterium]|nr:lysyl oxidase family protein [Acidimicrobiales bacterium]